MGNNMGAYKRIMLAVDLTEETNRVAQRAVALAKAFDADLHVIHVIEPLSLAYGGDIPMDLSSVQEQIHEQAKSHLAEFASALQIPEDHQRPPWPGVAARVHRQWGIARRQDRRSRGASRVGRRRPGLN